MGRRHGYGLGRGRGRRAVSRLEVTLPTLLTAVAAGSVSVYTVPVARGVAGVASTQPRPRREVREVWPLSASHGARVRPTCAPPPVVGVSVSACCSAAALTPASAAPQLWLHA